MNQRRFAVGQALKASASVHDAGLRETADLYLGALLPDGVTIVFWTGGRGTAVGRRDDVRTFRPYASGVVPPFSASLPEFFTYEWTGGEAPGGYVFFNLVTKAGAAAAGTLTGADVLGVATAPFSFP